MLGYNLSPFRGTGGSIMNAKKKFTACLLLTLVFAAVAAAQTYTVTDLGTLSGFSSSLAYDNNSSGQITGCSDNSMLPTVPCTTNIAADAYLWSNGVMKDLEHLSGDDSSAGYVVNDSGDVVGYSANTQTGVTRGFFWTQSGGMIGLEALKGGESYSVADAITSKGVIVGQSLVANGQVHVVLWRLSGKNYQIHDEGHLPGAPYCYAYAINENLLVTGIGYFNFSGTKYHGFLWSAAAGWKDLRPLPGGKNSEGIWVNKSAVVAGTSTSAKYPNGVTVYWDAAGIHPIGTLPGGDSSYPGFITDSGEILGTSTVAGGDNRAFIWTKKKGMRDLNNLIPKNSGWDLHHAASVNAAGQIVGYGTINGEDHGFLLTP